MDGHTRAQKSWLRAGGEWEEGVEEKLVAVQMNGQTVNEAGTAGNRAW